MNPVDTDTVKYFQNKTSNLPKSSYTVVSQSALVFSPTERLKQLSKPKIRKDNWVREDFPKDRYDPSYSGVQAEYLDSSVSCSKRIEHLAYPKELPENYRFARKLPTKVRHPSASPEISFRMVELSKPKRNPFHE